MPQVNKVFPSSTPVLVYRFGDKKIETKYTNTSGFVGKYLIASLHLHVVSQTVEKKEGADVKPEAMEVEEPEIKPKEEPAEAAGSEDSKDTKDSVPAQPGKCSYLFLIVNDYETLRFLLINTA